MSPKPSLRAKRSNPESRRGDSLDCFGAVAPRNDDLAAPLRVAIRHVKELRAKIRVLAALSRPSLASVAHPPNRERAGKGRVQAAPMARQQKEKLAAVTTGLAEHPAFPAQRCYGL
jgi:hypothetical protein